MVEAYDNRSIELFNTVVANYCKRSEINDSKPIDPPIYQTELFSATH